VKKNARQRIQVTRKKEKSGSKERERKLSQAPEEDKPISLKTKKTRIIRNVGGESAPTCKSVGRETGETNREGAPERPRRVEKRGGQTRVLGKNDTEYSPKKSKVQRLLIQKKKRGSLAEKKGLRNGWQRRPEREKENPRPWGRSPLNRAQ